MTLGPQFDRKPIIHQPRIEVGVGEADTPGSGRIGQVDNRVFSRTYNAPVSLVGKMMSEDARRRGNPKPMAEVGPEDLQDYGSGDRLSHYIEKGVTHPILIGKRGGVPSVIDGHHRFTAATMRGDTHIPVQIVRNPARSERPIYTSAWEDDPEGHRQSVVDRMYVNGVMRMHPMRRGDESEEAQADFEYRSIGWANDLEAMFRRPPSNRALTGLDD